MPDCNFSNSKNLRSDAITFEDLRAPYHEFEETEKKELPPASNVFIGLPPNALELETVDMTSLIVAVVVVVIFILFVLLK